MNEAVQLNLVLGWAWIVLGFVAGAILGMFFEKPDWMGGYGSLPRRMARLGHISFFGLAIINLLFVFSVSMTGLDHPALVWTSRLFALGAITMPMCCILMALTVKAKLLFGIPVISLLTAGGMMLWMVIGST